MSRFLLRRTANESDAETSDDSTNRDEPAPADDPPAIELTPARKPAPRRRSSTRAAAAAKKTDTAAADAETPAPRRTTRRRSNGGTSSTAAKNGAKGAAARAKSSDDDEADAPAKPPARKRSTRRKTTAKADEQQPETAPVAASDSAIIAAIERQTALLEQQGKAIQQLAEAQLRLTETMLGHERRPDEPRAAQIEVLPRLAIFVDVPNILYAAEESGVRLNWGKVASFLSRGRTLVRAIAYAPISDDPSARTENERFVLPFLEHGYRIATKPLKRFSGGSVKANFDVELAIDVLTMSDRVDVIVLVSGDGDFRRLVEIVGSRGVRVEVMAFGSSTSQDLRIVADRYIDFAGHVPELVN